MHPAVGMQVEDEQHACAYMRTFRDAYRHELSDSFLRWNSRD
jgi:hypothetical protein